MSEVGEIVPTERAPAAQLAAVKRKKSGNPTVTGADLDRGRNGRDLPSEVVLWAPDGSTILRTDTYGWIELSIDGDQLWVEVERVPTSK